MASLCSIDALGSGSKKAQILSLMIVVGNIEETKKCVHKDKHSILTLNGIIQQ